jgi:carbon monoxide dehydrogenase subunit G
MTVKVGPLAAAYQGKGKFTEIDEQAHQARLVGDAKELRGSGSVKVSMQNSVAPLASGGSEVVVNADIDLVGTLAQFGRGMIQEVSRQMFRQFSTCVTKQLEVAEEPQPEGEPADQPVDKPTPPQEAKAVAAAPLAFRALWAIIARFFNRLFGREEKKA